MAYVRTIDVSKWQGAIDWVKVRASGVAGAWIKVSGADGGLYADARGAENMAGAERAGLPWGTYHFARPARGDARGQARYAISKGYGRGRLWPALDMETNPDGLSREELDRWTAEFCAETYDRTDRESIIYTGAHFGVGFTSHAPDCPLWIANYGRNVPGTNPPDFNPAIPSQWAAAGWSMWQFNSVTRVDGIPGNTVDQNVAQPGFWATQLSQPNGDDDVTPEDINTIAHRVADLLVNSDGTGPANNLTQARMDAQANYAISALILAELKGPDEETAWRTVELIANLRGDGPAQNLTQVLQEIQALRDREPPKPA